MGHNKLLSICGLGIQVGGLKEGLCKAVKELRLIFIFFLKERVDLFIISCLKDSPDETS